MGTILVVEDSHSQRECISQQLIWRGLKAIQACDGVEALEKIDRNIPDLILLDITMPRIDGYYLCRLLKANPETRNIPVVFLTCKPQHLALEWSIKHADAYITKPWQSRELIATIKRLLQDAKNWRYSASADAWTEYAILNLNLIKLYECRADVWAKYGLQITRFYDCALNAFEQALSIDPNHLKAIKYRDKVRETWLILLEKLEQTKPCHICSYYYGKEGINCALHPFGPTEELCRDWEFK